MEYLNEIKKKFGHLLEKFKDDLHSVRTNRPTPKLIENISVDYLGQLLPIKQLGSIGTDLPRDLVVSVWDQNTAASVASAIEGANLGLRASCQGKIVRATLPDLTQERKQELAKLIKSMAEEERIKMRVERDEALKIIKELKDEDDCFRAKGELQKMVDEFNHDVDATLESKNKEIFE
ncbi:MAG: hypothetical protein A2Y84_02250 [Candidatus Colwellbacteria bacterium RBG_13_48_8]|uniref:Ribosome recycling factor domain-containing protein n=1 Tax=Candidatus Colwellbacteria bacterium RBG_13_48_8 TaxID=1797685 RepID=A0A1G1Z074_9BACT|nr:MAG: hypothetical protein A2Y84_02250 [Candidatus Colwellbacteria bacterium RBG_13_48_8]